jgi:hypothetical protein
MCGDSLPRTHDAKAEREAAELLINTIYLSFVLIQITRAAYFDLYSCMNPTKCAMVARQTCVLSWELFRNKSIRALLVIFTPILNYYYN